MDNNNNQPQNGGGNLPKNQFMVMLIAAIITLVAVTVMKNVMVSGRQKEVTYSDFIEEVADGEVDSVIIKNSEIDIQYKESSEKFNPVFEYYTIPVEKDYRLADRLLEQGVEIKREKQDSSMLLESLLSFLLPFICIVIFMNLMMKKMGGGGIMGKSNAKVYMQKETGVTFEDVAGQDEAKESLVELVDFLH
ncbi:MAG: ATP-dependent metallopeptidase FtsH/Yme1/Tma family protein, partial [Lachnospiraceae bacterium]|nr:ATP-dependent metallopeptidase FtsH/Yme1/Tma family protein [Lachnospiraceae bacterium]